MKMYQIKRGENITGPYTLGALLSNGVQSSDLIRLDDKESNWQTIDSIPALGPRSQNKKPELLQKKSARLHRVSEEALHQRIKRMEQEADVRKPLMNKSRYALGAAFLVMLCCLGLLLSRQVGKDRMKTTLANSPTQIVAHSR